MVELYSKDAQEPNEDLIRHMIFNSIRAINHRFKSEYGELIICIDGPNYWRKEIFPYYKAGRKQTQDNSKFDWNMIHGCMNKIRAEVLAIMPFKCIMVDGAEADDVIAELTRLSSSRDDDEKVLIVSGDEDFIQLQEFHSVYQYSYSQKKMLISKNPVIDLLEKIIRGDHGDGIPNILSPANAFVDKIRQKSIFQKKLDIWLDQDPKEFCTTPEIAARFEQNKKLIDFEYIPDWVRLKIQDEFKKAQIKPISLLYQHLINNQMVVILDSIQDFAPFIKQT